MAGISGATGAAGSTGPAGATGATNGWSLTGNSGSNPATDFIGTSDNQPLEIKVNGAQVMRFDPAITNGAVDTSPNVIGGDAGNSASAGVQGATIAGGGGLSKGSPSPNLVEADFGTVAGGFANTITASGENGTVGGGFNNTVSGGSANVGGGYSNNASNTAAMVGGGNSNTASGENATVAGGQSNIARGFVATVAGGANNLAAGTGSFAAGTTAEANNDGSFVWADISSGTHFADDRANQFKVRAAGGVDFEVDGASHLSPPALLVDSTSSDGVGLWVTQTSNDVAGVFTNDGTGDLLKGFGSGGLEFEVTSAGTVNAKNYGMLSDRNRKENFATVDSSEVLKQVASLPVSRWNFIGDKQRVAHIGPMAQDFHGAFKVGEDDKHIDMVDADGVALAAIQGLYKLLREKDAELAAQREQLTMQGKQIRALQVQQAALARQMQNSAVDDPSSSSNRLFRNVAKN